MELEACHTIWNLNVLCVATVWVAQGILESAVSHEEPSQKR